MEEKYGFVYIWRDRKHKRYYIGAHWGTEDDGYICSSTWMKNSYKRRPHDFKRRILKRIYTSKKDMFLEEHNYFKMVKDEELGKKYYNLNKTWQHWSSDKNRKLSVKEKISKSLKGRKRAGLFENWKHTEKTKEKLRIAAIKQFSTEEARKKHSENTKKGMTEKVKKHISEKQKGRIPWNKMRPISEKYRDAHKKPCSEKRRAAISNGRRIQIERDKVKKL